PADEWRAALPPLPPGSWPGSPVSVASALLPAVVGGSVLGALPYYTDVNMSASFRSAPRARPPATAASPSRAVATGAPAVLLRGGLRTVCPRGHRRRRQPSLHLPPQHRGRRSRAPEASCADALRRARESPRSCFPQWLRTRPGTCWAG